MRYIVVSDLHGNEHYFMRVLQVLENRGWTLDEDGQLYHPHETLIVAGDVIDRGRMSAEIAHYLWTHDNGCVISLMGNHDIKLHHYFYSGRNFNHPDWKATEESLKKNSHLLSDLARAVNKLPYTFTGEGFQVAHAYYSRSKEMCIYGPTSEGMRDKWWENEVFDKVTIFGHYHHRRQEWTNPDNGSVCVDTWDDDGVFTYAVVHDNYHDIAVEVHENVGWPIETDVTEYSLAVNFIGRYF